MISPTIPPARRGVVTAAIALTAVVVAALLWWGADQIRPLPPHHIVMTTGPEGSTYHDLGLQYRALLAEHGIDLELRPSAGDAENLARLEDSTSGVDVGFLQGGLTDARRSPGLYSLGTVLIQPLWIFYRQRGKPASGYLEQFDSVQLSVGEVGSGTRALAFTLIRRAKIDTDSAKLHALSPDSAAAALMQGRIDAAVMLTGWDAPAVQQLLAAPGVTLLQLRRIEAFVALYPFLQKVVLPEGAGDLATDNPPTDVSLLADKTSLVIRRGLHPAIQHVLLDAAEQIQARPGMFNAAGQFPAPEAVDFALSSDARHYYKSGRPFLQQHLPFWLAAVVERVFLLLLPLLGVVLPLVRFAPEVYLWTVRRRVFSLYAELRGLEAELDAPGGDGPAQALIDRLDRLDRKANAMRMPASHSPMLYTLRHHITLVRQRIEGR